ncbi:hypothetical protein DL93DRAFT_2156867 [Clavulina sp. PMI_390]|nr:hypothetical protein DL93DRAFT_2156867 [Clavulina sp. PMI_390]
MAELYSPGTTISLGILSPSRNVSHHLSATVTESFYPFTNGQVMRVKLDETRSDEYDGPELPRNAVLKLYDRRFMDGRPSRHQWSEPGETDVQWAWSQETWCNDEETDEDDNNSDDEDIDEMWWENHYAEICLDKFKAEHSAYRLLEHLQGSILPRLYTAICVQQPGYLRGPRAPKCEIFGLLMEDVSGFNFQTYDASEVDGGTRSSVTALTHILMAAVSTFTTYGVVHRDIRRANIIVNLSGFRIILFDFGNALVREQGETDEEWEEAIEWTDDMGRLRHVLHNWWSEESQAFDPRMRVRPETPMDIRQAIAVGDIAQANRVPLRYEDELRERWFSPVTEWSEPTVDVRDSKEATSVSLDSSPERLQWRLRPDVEAWFDARPPLGDPQRYLAPRPGSPVEHAASRFLKELPSIRPPT